MRSSRYSSLVPVVPVLLIILGGLAKCPTTAMHRGKRVQISRVPFIAYCEGLNSDYKLDRFVGTILNQRTVLTTAFFCKKLTDIRLYVGAAIQRGSSPHLMGRYKANAALCVMGVSPYLPFGQNVQKITFPSTNALPPKVHSVGWGEDQDGLTSDYLKIHEYSVAAVDNNNFVISDDDSGKDRLDWGDGGAPIFSLATGQVWGVVQITGPKADEKSYGNLTSVHITWILKARDAF